jgi:putative ABC transport system ATP-binding protein
VATRVPAEHTTTPSRPASATARPAPSRPRSAAEPGREPSRVVTPQPTARPSRPTIQPAAPTPAPVEQVDLIDESLFIPEQGIAAEVVEAVAEQALPTQTTRRREPEASAAPVTQPALAKPRPTSRPEMEPPATKPAPTRPRPVAPAMAHTPSGSEVVALRQVTKVYGDGATQVEALRGVDLGFTQGGLTVILGPAGAGKSTLLHCMAGLETPTSGVVTVAGHTVSSMNAKELAEFRRSQVGFIFSAPTLLDGLTVAQNIQLASDIKKEKADEAWFDQVVDALGLADVLSQRPAQLSPLQQQAVACARAIITKPVAVFADEPCAQLDSAQAFQFTQLLLKATRMLNQTVVMATADPSLAARGDRTIFLSDGVAVDQIIDPSVDKVLSVVRSLVGARAGA